MTRDDKNYIAQIALALETVAILLVGVFVGVLMPDGITEQIRSSLSRSVFSLSVHQMFNVALVLACFLIVHQFMCWMGQVKESKRRFAETNRWGNILFIYGCAGLILFSAGILCLQIVGI